jgi:hypothetical protein
MARDSWFGASSAGDGQVDALVGVAAKPTHFAPDRGRAFLTHRVAVKKVFTHCCQLAKQRNGLRFAGGYLLIEDSLRLPSSSSQR